MTKEEIENRAEKYVDSNPTENADTDVYYAFVNGAEWMQEQLEQNRLTHMTKEEIEQRVFEITNIVCGEDDTEAWDKTKKKSYMDG